MPNREGMDSRRSLALRAATFVIACVTALVAVGGAEAASDDPMFGAQWGLQKVGGPMGWTKSLGTGVTIAVVDTGVDLAHEDLAGRIVADVSCIGADGDPDRCSGSGQDDHGHGSHVAGIAAAVEGNGKGIAGVAPEASIMAVRVLQKEENGDGASGAIPDIAAGIDWAVEHGADVVNLSLGENVLLRNLLGSGLDAPIRRAWDAGVVPVIAAGNVNSLFGSGYGSLPALVVTATMPDDTKASYATDVGSAQWGMAAPGGDDREPDDDDPEDGILSLWYGTKPNAYAYASGTSMAAPHVAGAAALLLSVGFSPEATVNRLLESSVDIEGPGRDAETGYGRLDVASALADQAPRSLPRPTVTTVAAAGRGAPAPPPPTPTPRATAVPPPAVPSTTATVPTEAAPTTVPAPDDDSTITGIDEEAAAVPSDAPGSNSLGPWAVLAGTMLGLVGAGFRYVVRRARFEYTS